MQILHIRDYTHKLTMICAIIKLCSPPPQKTMYYSHLTGSLGAKNSSISNNSVKHKHAV